MLLLTIGKGGRSVRKAVESVYFLRGESHVACIFEQELGVLYSSSEPSRRLQCLCNIFFANCFNPVYCMG